MSALLLAASGRKFTLAALGILFGSIAITAAWHYGWLSQGLAHLAHQPLSWLGVSLVIFVAATISSTVGFAFSAIAAAMIFHLVPDAVEGVQIMMVASIAIQSYSVVGLWRTISLRACAP